jgi:2-dehydropantoate 2-reductase
MRHAILGAGGVGGLIGGALARTGAEVELLLRPEMLAQHPSTLRIESVVLGDFEVGVAIASRLDREPDVLWVTPKATQLESALGLARATVVDDAVVVPLMNGVDHVASLRGQYAHVLAGAIFVESERVEPGLVRQKSSFARVALAPGPRRDEIASELRAAGFEVTLSDDETTLLWEKLVLLAPIALTTTARGAPVGEVQADPEWNGLLMQCHDEAVAVGLADKASLDPARLRRTLLEFRGDEMRTSMQKDFDAGRPLELDAIGGAIVRAGRRHEIGTPVTEELMRRVGARPAPSVP